VSPTQGSSPSNGEQPGLEAGVVTKVPQFPKRQQERLLHYILGIGGATQRGKRGPIHRLTVTEDQLSERCRVPSQGSLDELVIGHTWCRDALWRFGWQFQIPG
jgi:hypothetical protein